MKPIHTLCALLAALFLVFSAGCTSAGTMSADDQPASSSNGGGSGGSGGSGGY